MSDQEQYAIAGKTVAEYAAVRRELAALVRKAGEYADTFRGMHSQLSPNTSNPHQAQYDFGNPTFGSLLSRYPGREEVEHLAREIGAAMARKRELALALRELGVEPKD